MVEEAHNLSPLQQPLEKGHVLDQDPAPIGLGQCLRISSHHSKRVLRFLGRNAGRNPAEPASLKDDDQEYKRLKIKS